MLTVNGLVTNYGGSSRVLDQVDMIFPDGRIVAVLGGNGAGKSTLLRAISGTLPLHRGAIQSGVVELDGRRLNKMTPAAITRSGIVQAPEGRQVFTRMTVEENLRVGALTTPRGRREAAHRRVLDLFPPLSDRSNQRAGLLSGGEQQMLAIGRALMAEPKVLLLDEPSLGLAPKLIDQIGEIVTTINEQGTSVVLVEQNAAMALRVAHEAVVLEVGRVAMSGTSEELAASEAIQELYLGGHAEDHSHHEEAPDGSSMDSGQDGVKVRARTISRWTR